MEEYDFISTDRDGHIFTVTINRPEVMNALHPPASAEMADAWDVFANDPQLWVAVICGAGGRAFSAGNDLKYQAAGSGSAALPASGFGGLTSRFDLYKPVIAAVGGVALGGGFEIALACDIIIASDDASFGLPEPKVGMAALAGGLHRLPRQVGLKTAMAMMLTGRHIDAAEAYRIGLVQEVCSRETLSERASAWAEEIASCAPLSVRASKQAALAGLGLPLETAMAERSPAIYDMLHSEDYQEGPRAFAGKRRPRWKSR